MSAGDQIRQASKQTIKNDQCGSNPPKGVPQANSHNTWALARQGGYLWPIGNWEQRYATTLTARRRPHVAARRSVPVPRVPSPAAVLVVPMERRVPLATGLGRPTSRRRPATVARRNSTAASIPPPTAMSAATVGRLLPTAVGLIVLPGSRRHPLVTRWQTRPSRSPAKLFATLIRIGAWSRPPAAARRQ